MCNSRFFIVSLSSSRLFILWNRQSCGATAVESGLDRVRHACQMAYEKHLDQVIGCMYHAMLIDLLCVLSKAVKVCLG